MLLHMENHALGEVSNIQTYFANLGYSRLIDGWDLYLLQISQVVQGLVTLDYHLPFSSLTKDFI
jgi:hypothetical protein